MATKAETKAPALEFIGPPRRLIAVGNLPADPAGELRLEGEISSYMKSGPGGLKLRRRRHAEAPELRLRLAPNTPAGDYKATLKAGKKSQAVIVRVLPETRVAVSPAELSFRGAAGARVTQLATLINKGNETVEVPRTAAVGIFDDDGIETAFASTYGKKVTSVDAFLTHFTGKLREAHGGLMKLALKRGAGRHAPGTAAALEIVAELPAGLVAGHRYHGVWSTDFASFAVSVIAQK